MAMKSDSIEGLINQAQAQGGQNTQSAEARALAGAASGGGNLIANLLSAGAGNSQDGRIRQIQQQAERHGWSDNDRAMVNTLRQSQSGAALDARSLAGLQFSQGGGGGYGGGNEGNRRRMGDGDMLTQLAEMLGQYKASREYNQRNSGVGMDSNYNKLAQAEATGGIETLGPLYDELMKQKKLETRMLQQQANENENKNRKVQVGGWNVPLGGTGYGQRDTSSTSFRQEADNDRGYGQVRDEALKAALRYMKINAPHLLGSL